MSAFLGPVHHWVYKKICYQNTMLLPLMQEASLEKVKVGQLEEIIDKDNIHQWLDHQVKLVNSYYQYLIDKNLPSLKQHLYEEGKKLSHLVNHPKDVFMLIKDYQLDGMPCDQAFSVVLEEEDHMIIHYHREAYLIDFDLLQECRHEWIKGVILNKWITYQSLGNDTYAIKQEESK